MAQHCARRISFRLFGAAPTSGEIQHQIAVSRFRCGHRKIRRACRRLRSTSVWILSSAEASAASFPAARNER
jgi:hypothetical protein